MDPTDLTDLSGLASDGADLSANAPDIQINVAPSSFDPSINYSQDPVTGLYNPGGFPVGFMGTDATQVALTNGLTLPTGTEDAVAYSANVDTVPTQTDTVSPTDVTNTDGGPVDANSQGSAPVNPAPSGSVAGWMHGIEDAVTSLVKAAPAIASIANATISKSRTPAPSLTTQQRNGAPMLAPHPTTGSASSLSQLAGTLEKDTGFSPAMLALVVGAIGLLIVGATA